MNDAGGYLSKNRWKERKIPVDFSWVVMYNMGVLSNTVRFIWQERYYK